MVPEMWKFLTVPKNWKILPTYLKTEQSQFGTWQEWHLLINSTRLRTNKLFHGEDPESVKLPLLGLALHLLIYLSIRPSKNI